MKFEIPFSRIGAENTAKARPLPLCLDRKNKQKFLDLTKRGKSDDIAHGSIIQVSTVHHISKQLLYLHDPERPLS